MIRYAFRLACANLRRTQNVTLPFFIASTVTVFLHFLIMTMMFNPHVPEIRGGSTLAFIFQLGVFVITTFAILFMISIHQMLLKKRKKELGLYRSWEWEKKHISWILFRKTPFKPSLHSSWAWCWDGSADGSCG